MMGLPKELLKERLLDYLREDVGQGDITSVLLVGEGACAKGDIFAKEKGIVAGMEEIEILLEAIGIRCKPLVKDGSKIEPGMILAHIEGDARCMLTVERTILNVLCRMSGIATETRDLQDKVASVNPNAKVASTRKVAPGCLYFDKRAVMIGGGDLHRLHLDDLILIKDNHIALAGGVREAVQKARRGSFTKKIEVEVTSLEEALEASEAGADIIMFDNMPPAGIKTAIERLRREVNRNLTFEASGGINASNILEYARSGVDILSLGCLTHSPKSLNMSLEIRGMLRSQT